MEVSLRAHTCVIPCHFGRNHSRSEQEYVWLSAILKLSFNRSVYIIYLCDRQLVHDFIYFLKHLIHKPRWLVYLTLLKTSMSPPLCSFAFTGRVCVYSVASLHVSVVHLARGDIYRVLLKLMAWYLFFLQYLFNISQLAWLFGGGKAADKHNHDKVANVAPRLPS